jgi:dienelactone hydrolase
MTTQTVTYTDAGTTLKGFLAYDDKQTGKRPGILVMPEAFGLGKNAKARAQRLADELGYVALGGDPFGDGREFTDLQEAIKVAGALMADPAKFRARARAGIDKLASLPQVDSSRLAAIGYCMGGTFALELARDGAPLRGVVSFHGGLQTQRPAAPGQIKAKVLVCHGSDDPMIQTPQVNAFIDEMTKAQADWQLISYGNTVHSFTNPDADGTMMPGIKFNAQSDARSWVAMKNFFEEVFAK